jgi:hypothetical protein
MPLDRAERWAWCYVHERYFQGVREDRSAAGFFAAWWRRLTAR